MRYKVTLSIIILLGACVPAPQGEVEITAPLVRYASATTASGVVDTLPSGVFAYLFDRQGEWALVCYRGIKGWVRLEEASGMDYVEKEPLENSLLAFAPDESVAVAIDEDERRMVMKLAQFQPWFVPGDSLYAGFYEGVPGEDVGLVIVNVLPTTMSLTVKVSLIDPESLEPREEEYIFTSEVQREENLLTIQSEDTPFQKAEFIRQGPRRGLLIQQREGYAVLWKRRL